MPNPLRAEKASGESDAVESTEMTLEQRSQERRKRIEAHRATSFADAERWDLDYWQSKTPEERLSALVAIRRDVEVVEAGRDLEARGR